MPCLGVVCHDQQHPSGTCCCSANTRHAGVKIRPQNGLKWGMSCTPMPCPHNRTCSTLPAHQHDPQPWCHHTTAPQPSPLQPEAAGLLGVHAKFTPGRHRARNHWKRHPTPHSTHTIANSQNAVTHNKGRGCCKRPHARVRLRLRLRLRRARVAAAFAATRVRTGDLWVHSQARCCCQQPPLSQVCRTTTIKHINRQTQSCEAQRTAAKPVLLKLLSPSVRSMHHPSAAASYTTTTAAMAHQRGWY